MIKKLLRKNILNLKPYSSARDEFTKKADIYLDANENPFENNYNRYPDPYQKKLKKIISDIKNIKIENILLGNGSDEVLDLIIRSFCNPSLDNIIITPPTYGIYKVLADINDIKVKESVLNNDFSLNIDDILSKIDKNTKIIFICSPNNPTGNIISKEKIELLLNKNLIVVVDEAYIDFSNAKSWIHEISNHKNLIVSQTLSKAWGLAGIRIGMCFASSEIISVLNKVKPPYNISSISQNKAIEVLSDIDSFKEKTNTLINEKTKLESKLMKIKSVEKIFPSETNFILVKFKNANKLYKKLVDKDIIIRNRSNQILCDNCLRITIGTPIENEILLKNIKILSE